MNKYIFNNDRLANIVSGGLDAPRDSWARKLADAMNAPAFMLDEATSAGITKIIAKAYKAWYEVYETVNERLDIHTIRMFWPSNEEEDFAIVYQTRDEYNANRYPTVEGREGYGYSIRAAGLRGTKLMNKDDVFGELRTKIEAMVGEAPLDVEIKDAEFPAGAQVISLVYRQPEGQARKPWMDAARWPVELIHPEMATGQYIEMTEEGVVLRRVSEGEAEQVYLSSAASGATLERLASDIAMLSGSMADRITSARNSYYAEVRARMRANVTETTTVKVRTPEEIRKSEAAFGAHRKEHKKKLEESLKGKEAIAMLPFIGHGYASSRRWGIEIESGGARGIDAPKGWKRKGDGSLRSAWDGWVNDGSLGEIQIPRQEVHISPENCPTGVDHRYDRYDPETGNYILVPTYDPNCTQCDTWVWVEAGPAPIGHRFEQQHDDRAEFVSPILGSMHSKGLESLLVEINKQPQNNSAGVHVHVEATDLTPKQLGSLVYGYDRIEGLIESSYRRTKRDYCKLRSDEQTLSVLKKAKTVSRLLDVPAGDRYVTLNLCSLSAHGTVEFRAMGNVYDYEYLSRWAMFCREMVNVAKAGVTAKEWNSVSSWADVTALFAKYGKEYIRAVMDTMGEEVPSSPRLKRDGSVSMPTGNEAPTSEIAVSGSTFADLVATMDEGAVNSRWITTVEESIAGITSESSQRVLVGALASGETEV